MAPSQPPKRLGPCSVGVPVDGERLPLVGSGEFSTIRGSRTSRWRAGVLIGVHVLIAAHVTHYLVAGRTLSPVEPSESMYTLELGYLNCGFVFFALSLAATATFGRFFCGWGCHLVALQDLCGWIMKKLGVRPRPFRSRLLAFGPAILAFYMFAWPTLKRLATGRPGPFPGFTNHLLTDNIWATFPGPVMASLTFLVCGFAAVYVLGSKGFCTYGCPYGAVYGGLDALSPGRIVVNENCHQCGHCTATCTSNVRVHEEVRLFGMVVDKGCMKCMDCVSVCPKDALAFKFAKPSILKRSSTETRAKTYDLALREELSVAAVALLATLAFRNLYDGPPLLMSLGLGGITAFVALKLWHLLSRPTVRIQSVALKLTGQVQAGGRVFAALAILWLAFVGHSGFVQWHRAWGRHELDRTEVTREDGLSGIFRARQLSSRHERAAAEAFRHFTLADRWGLKGVVEVKLGLAWCHVLRSELGAATAKAEEALAIAPDTPTLQQNLADIRRAERPTAEDHFRLGNAFADAGRLEEAATAYEACVAAAPDSAPARFDLGGVLRRLGKNEEAVGQLREARRLAPEDADVCVELGLAYMATGRNDEAIEAFERAMALAPDSPEARQHLPDLIAKLRR